MFDINAHPSFFVCSFNIQVETPLLAISGIALDEVKLAEVIIKGDKKSLLLSNQSESYLEVTLDFDFIPQNTLFFVLLSDNHGVHPVGPLIRK